MDDMQDLNWLASEIDSINDINELNKIIQTSQGIPALLANDRKTKLMKFQQQVQGAQALAQGQKPPVMAQIKGQAAQQDAARQAQMMQLAQLAALQQPQDEGLAALPYDEEEGESPEYQGTENESAEEGEGAAMGGLVALAQGGSVDGPKKDFADKTVDNLTGLLHDWYDNSVFSMAQGGPVRGFSGLDGSSVELSDFERRHPEVLNDTMASRWGDEFAQHAQTDKDLLGTDILGSVADRWKDTIGHHAQTDKDVLGAIANRWKNMHAEHVRNSDDFARGLKQTWDESTAPIGGPADRTPRMSASDAQLLEEKGAFGPRRPSTLDKISQALTPHTPNPTPSAAPVESGVSAQQSAPGWGAPDIASSDDPWTMGLRTLGATPMRPTGETSPWDQDAESPAVKSEIDRHHETELASDKTRAPGARTANATPPAGGQTTTTPPAGGQTTAAPGGQEQGQQRLTNELEQHPHQEEIINTIDNPKLSWQDKVKYLQEVIGAPYQMSPELLSKYEKQLADMRSEKGWMTGLSFLTGVLGAKTPWLSQALSEGGIQALGTYGKYAGDESKLEQGLLEQQMGIEKAPVEARQKAGLKYLEQTAAAQKEAADLKKAALTGGLRYQGVTDSAYIRNKGGMDKAAFDRQTRLAVQALANEAKRAGTPPSADRANSTAAQLLALDPTYSLMPEGPDKRAYFTKFAKSLHDGAVAMHSGQPMGNIGGTGQPIVIPHL